MHLRHLAFAAAAAALVALPATASAQAAAPAARIALGTWTGTVTPPGQETTPVSYTVAAKNDTISISLDAGPHGTFQASEISIEAKKVSFVFYPGPKVVCVLYEKEDKSYAGLCTADDGSAADMVMNPPKEGGA